jgi:VCBS repeat-containing protein
MRYTGLTAAFAAAIALAASAPAAHAQKALVYCPVTIDAGGCDRIVSALKSKFADSVDRGFDGSSGTLDLKKIDLQHYAVFVVPSLADDATKQPYALLRSVAPRLHMAINGRVAVYSGAPDQGAANRSDKDALIQNLARWAANGHTHQSGLVGLVAFLDLSEKPSDRYAWVNQISLVDVSADQELQAFGDITPVTSRGGDMFSAGGRPVRFSNMASYGLHIGGHGAARTEVSASGGGTSRQSVLVQYSNADGASESVSGASTGRVGSSGASFSLSGTSSKMSATTSSTTSGPTIATDKPDYMPGDTVTFSGSGWVAGDTVTITIHEDPHWTQEDRTVVAVADGTGNFTNHSFVVDPHDLGVTFTATAVANPSGLVAQMTFTDAQPQLVTITSGTSVTVIAGTNASYAISVTINGSASNCTVTLSTTGLPSGATGSFTSNPFTGTASYTSTLTVTTTVATTAGSYPFTITAVRGADCQGNGNLTANGTLVVTAANTPPAANADSYGTNEDVALTVNAATGVLSNDTDAEHNSLTAIRPAGPSANGGTVTLNADGSFTYTPPANFNGSDSFTYNANDGTTNSTTTATVTITVNAVNDAPSFTKGADQTVLEDAAAQSVATWATAISAGPANENTQVVDFVVSNNNNALFSVQPAVAANGTLTYTPAANANGVATVTIHAHDNGGTANSGVDFSADQTFSITVTAVNDAPSFTKGADQTVNEDAGAQTVATWATAILAGPPNEAGQTLTFSVTSNTNAALFSAGPAISATGDLTYTPAANANGTATIKIKLTDNGGTANGGVDASAEQTFVITVNPVNDAPSFTKGADQTVNEDAAAQTVAGWATAVSAGPNETQVVTFTATNDNNALFSVQPSVDATGKLTYTPAANAFGVATVTVTLKDDGGTANGGVDTSAPQTFTITINPVNDAPSFTKGADQTVNEDAGAQTVAGWATAISAGPANESGQAIDFVVSNSNNALFSIQPAVAANGTLTYTPAANANGSATVTLHVHDNGGVASGGVDASAAQTFTITVSAVNDAPIFTKGADQTILEDAAAQSVSGWATGINAGAPDESAQTLTFNVTGNTNSALFSVQPSIDASGKLTFTPAADAFGTATITLTLSDNGGTANGGVDTSAPQTFTITIKPVNDAPSFTKGADQTKLEDAGAQTVTGWATAISKGPANESAQVLTFLVTNTNNALFSAQPAIDASGQLTYTPAANANGSATVSVVLKDDGGTADGGIDATGPQTFTITITAVNDAPSFVKGANQNVNEDSGAQSVSGWATAMSAGPADESGQTLTFHVSNDNNALFSGQPSIDASGKLTYTPAADAFGTATVTVSLMDNGGTANGGSDTSAPQTFTIDIAPVNDAPSFTKGADQTVNEDAGAQSVAGWATAISVGPANESSQTVAFHITGNTNASLFSTAPAIGSNGTLTYTPAPDAFGTATLTVVAQDNGGTANGGVDASAPQTFVITVNSVNDAPTFGLIASHTVLEDAGAQSVANALTSPSAGPANESGQVLTLTVTNNNNALFTVQPSIDLTTGLLTYTAAANANGSAVVTVKLMDNGGTANGGVDVTTKMLTITVTPVNDAPSFTKGANQTTLEDAGAQSVAWATAISAGPADEAGQALNFVVTNDNNALFSGQPAVSASGQLTYTAAPNANGSATVTVKLHDDGGTANNGVDTSPEQTFTITITAVNDAPSFTKGADQTVNEDAAAQTVAGWATALSAGPADESGQTLSFIVTNSNNALFSVQPAIDATGQLTYTPAPDANGSATVTVQIRDNGGVANGGVDTSPQQTFTITVRPVNDAPSFTKGQDQTKLEDAGAQSIAGWATAISKGPANESGQALTFTVTNSNNALFSSQPAIDASGKLTYTSALNANGSATVTVVLKDDGGTAYGGVDTAPTQTFTITITAVNDAPTFGLLASHTVAEDAGAQSISGALTSPLPGGGADESGQTLTLTVTNNNNSLFSAQPAIDGSGTLTYTSAANANGTATVTVTLKDNGGTANAGVDATTKTFTITVTPVNDAPVITDFSSPLAPNAVNTSVSASGKFNDVDLGDTPPDTHTGTIDWGDGSTTNVSIASGTGITRSFNGSHTYATPGVYTIVAQIKDFAGATVNATYQYVVIYDPSAGFVTGGGWINSPAGAYAANTSLSGKATFGFVSKYKKGQSTPDGDTEFQFQAAGFNFKSTSYEWLVIAGGKAQYKGSGTINGSGDYFFMLTAVDGGLKGGPDTFRIKVWDKTTLAVIYDNGLGASDTSDPTTTLGGGSIQIHDSGK